MPNRVSSKVSWQDKLKPGRSRVPAEGEVLFELCLLSGKPCAIAAQMLYDAGEFEQLVQLRLDPFFAEWNGYSAQEFFLANQSVQLFSKYADFPVSVDPEQRAFDKWLECEERCRQTNSLFRLRWEGKQAFPPSIERVISRARLKIKRILGEFSQEDLRKVREKCHFGPGADLSTKGSNTSWYSKFSTPGTVTPDCAQLIAELFGSEFSIPTRPEGWVDNEDTEWTTDCSSICDIVERAELVSTSRLAFVPKKALIHRPITVPPRWNIFVQLGIGEVIAGRLETFGIDIRDQTRNQRLASLCHRLMLATLDMTSASDLNAVNAVIDLMSEADPYWLELILATREPYTTYTDRKTGKEQTFRLEKVSSMGNGYTFPLETLLFFSLAWSASEECGLFNKDHVSVYGDDIIVPSQVAELLIQVFASLGHSVNTEKSFVNGGFYESCGQDYFQGKNVRPIFIKKKVDTVQEAFKLSNQLAVLAGRFIGIPGFAYGKIWNIRHLVIRRIPRSHRLFGPTDAGDGVIHETFDVALPTLRQPNKNHGWSGYVCRAFKVKPKPFMGWSYQGHLFSKLSGITDMGNRVVKRDSVVSRRGDVYFLRYTDTLPI